MDLDDAFERLDKNIMVKYKVKVTPRAFSGILTKSISILFWKNLLRENSGSDPQDKRDPRVLIQCRSLIRTDKTGRYANHGYKQLFLSIRAFASATWQR